MSRIPPDRRPEPDASAIVVGVPVSSLTWRSIGQLANWVNGKGAVLVPANASGVTIASGVDTVFRYYTHTRRQAVERIWTLAVYCNSGGTYLTIQAPGGPVGRVSVGTSISYVLYVEPLTAQSAAMGEVSLTLKGETAAVVVRSVECFEQDRAILAASTDDYAIDTFTAGSGQPIFDGSYESMGGIVDALANADARRVGLWSFCGGAAAVSSATPQALLSLDAPILAQKAYRGDTTGPVIWSAYCSLNTAGSGTVALTTTSGLRDELVITNTAGEWTIPRVIDVDCEDLAKDDGLQASTWEGVNVEYAGDGTRLNTLGAASVWTGDPALLLDITEGTFTRDSKAYRQISAPTDGSDKYLELMDSNVLRLNNNGDGYGDMVSLETTAFTNLVLSSEDLTDGGGLWVESNATINSPSESAPSGDSTACVVEMSDVSNGYVYQTVEGVSDGDRVRVSFYARMYDPPAGTIRAWFDDRAGTDANGSNVAITDSEWTRVEHVFAANSGANEVRIGARHDVSGNADRIMLWGFQAVIEGPATSLARGNTYVPTIAEGPSTQAAEFLLVPQGSYPDSFRSDGYIVHHRPFMSSAEMLAASTSGDQNWVIVCHASLNHYIQFVRLSGVIYVRAVSSGTKIQSDAVTFDAWQSLSIEVDPSAGTIRLGGFTTGNGTWPTDFTNLLPSTVTWGAATDTTITTGETDPLGGTDAVKLDGTSAAATGLVRSDVVAYRNAQTACEIWVKKDESAANFAGFELRAGGTGSTFVVGGVYLHLGTGECVEYGTGYSDPVCDEAVAGWWRLRFTQTGLAGTTISMRVRADAGFAASFPTADITATGPVIVYGANITYGSTPFTFPNGNLAIGGRLSGTILGSGGTYGRYILGRS